MADNNTSKTGNATQGGTNAVSPDPKGATGTTNSVHVGTGQKQDNESDQKQGGVISWDIIWPILLVVVFAVLWRTGKLQAFRKFVAETREQLSKCTWPTTSELNQHIVVVLLSSVLLAAFTVAADFVVRELVWGLLLDGNTVLNTPSGK